MDILLLIGLVLLSVILTLSGLLLVLMLISIFELYVLGHGIFDPNYTLLECVLVWIRDNFGDYD